jgi:hypothetical protein
LGLLLTALLETNINLSELGASFDSFAGNQRKPVRS